MIWTVSYTNCHQNRYSMHANTCTNNSFWRQWQIVTHKSGVNLVLFRNCSHDLTSLYNFYFHKGRGEVGLWGNFCKKTLSYVYTLDRHRTLAQLRRSSWLQEDTNIVQKSYKITRLSLCWVLAVVCFPLCRIYL